MFDARVFEIIGEYMAPATLLAGAVWGFAKRNSIAAYFAPRAVLIAASRAAELERDAAKQAATTARAAIDNQAATIESLVERVNLYDARIADLNAKVESLERKLPPLQTKLDAHTDWANLMLDHCAYLTKMLKDHNIPLAHTMPPVPAVLADRFNIPETLRDLNL